MKKLLSIVTTVAALALPAWAGITQVTYVEGTVDYRKGGAPFKALDFGNNLTTGDTVRTGKDGMASLSQSGVEITINPGTVFTLQEKEQNGKKQDVLAVTLGSIKMKYGKLSGQEPLLRTASAAAGVRGTELTMFAGSDGSSFIVVDSGSVEVSAEGKSVLLAPGDGVQVKPGQVPGDKFAIRRDQVDYASWDKSTLQSLIADPVGSMAALQKQLDSYAQSVAQYYADFMSHRDQLKAEREKAVALIDSDGKDAAKKYADEVITPLVLQTSNLNLNYRYFALTALSMRRYVVAHMYTQLKPLYINKEDDPVYVSFLSEYDTFLSTFETAIVPQLVENDI